MAINILAQQIRLDGLLCVRSDEYPAAVCAQPLQRELSGAEVVEIADLLGVDFAIAPFTAEDLQRGVEVELEIVQECASSLVDALDKNIFEFGMIAIANLQERSDYYTRFTQARAPGDPSLPKREHADVGAD